MALRSYDYVNKQWVYDEINSFNALNFILEQNQLAFEEETNKVNPRFNWGAYPAQSLTNKSLKEVFVSTLDEKFDVNWNQIFDLIMLDGDEVIKKLIYITENFKLLEN